MNSTYQSALDRAALQAARRVHARAHAVQNSFVSGTVTDLLFQNLASHTAVASTASEASLLAGTNMQPTIPATYFENQNKPGKTLRIEAWGQFSNTGTPTMTFQVRLGTTIASTYLSGTSVGASAAITTGSGVSTKGWYLRLDMITRTVGQGSGGTTLWCNGFVESPGGFAAPYKYWLTPGAGESATVTTTIDCSLTQYVNLSLTWSASSSSNTTVCTGVQMTGLN